MLFFFSLQTVYIDNCYTALTKESGLLDCERDRKLSSVHCSNAVF